MNFQATSTSYAIEVDRDKMLALLKREAACAQPWITLSEDLDEIDGVSRSDYNGHFGPCVYLVIDTESDNDKTKAAISRTIEKHLS